MCDYIFTSDQLPKILVEELEKIRQELRSALASDLGEALVMLRQKLGSTKVTDIVLQSGRYHQADSNFRKGLMEITQRDMVFNQVRNTLVEIVEQLTAADLAESASSSELAQKLGLHAGAQYLLIPLFEKLRLDWKKISSVHLVNCDRIEENRFFLNIYRRRRQQKQGSQFFFINACPMQRPESFAERIILEILSRYDDDEQQAILVRRKPQSERLLVEDLPFDPMGLSECKRLTAKYFQKRFGYHEHIERLEKYLQSCAQQIRTGKRYIAFIFRIHATDWDSLMTEYLHWLIDTFKHIETADGEAEYLFFFPVQVRNLHETPPASVRVALEEITRLQQATLEIDRVSNIPMTPYDIIMPLMPVNSDQVTSWFEELDEADAAKISELILLTLQRDKAALTRLQRYMDEGIVDMYDMEALQADLYEYATK